MTRWAPVVYARTAASDTWWRAIPATLDETGWLGSVVDAVVCGGRELDRAPRFVLAQDTAHRIIGVACQAADLSRAMSSGGHREFYCFVGWVASRAGPEPSVPSLQDLSGSYVAWAGPVYTEVLGRVWEVSPTAFCPPERTDPEQAPWPPADRDLAAVPRPGEGLWPEAAWAALWAAAQAASTPLTCVIGWRSASSARTRGATHVGVADAQARPLPVPPQVQPVPPAAPFSGPPVRVPAPRQVLTPKPLPGPLPGPLPAPTPAPPQPGGQSRKPPRRLPIPVPLGVAAVIGAAAGAVITVLASGSSPAAPPASPLTIQLVVPASAGPGQGALLRYRDGALTAGESTAQLATWSGGSAASAAACADTLRATLATAPIAADPGLRLCVELTGEPARYGLVEVTTVSPDSVTTLATIWP